MNDGFWHAKLASLSVMLLAFAIACARAHDHEHSWYESLRGGRGPRCDGGDAKRLDAGWDSKDGRYRVRIDGEWVDVPNDADGLALLPLVIRRHVALPAF